MTRLAVLSDIHGVWPAFEAVLNDMAQYSVDQVVVLGDSVNLGPSSAQVVEHILDSGWITIRGNNELSLLDYGTPRAPVKWQDRSQFAMLAWLDRQISPELKNAIAAWPDTLELRYSHAPSLRLVHGSLRSAIEGIYPTSTDAEVQALLAGTAEATVLAGHTHLPLDRQVGQWRVLNPGSVGLPLDGQQCAYYMLLEGDASGWRPTFRRLPVDYEPVYREFQRQGYVEECGVIAELIVDTFRTGMPWVVPFLRWRQEYHPGEPLTDEMLQAFRQQDVRDQYALPDYAAARRAAYGGYGGLYEP